MFNDWSLNVNVNSPLKDKIRIWFFYFKSTVIPVCVQSFDWWSVHRNESAQMCSVMFCVSNNGKYKHFPEQCLICVSILILHQASCISSRHKNTMLKGEEWFNHMGLFNVPFNTTFTLHQCNVGKIILKKQPFWRETSVGSTQPAADERWFFFSLVINLLAHCNTEMHHGIVWFIIQISVQWFPWPRLNS